MIAYIINRKNYLYGLSHRFIYDYYSMCLGMYISGTEMFVHIIFHRCMSFF